MSDINKRNTNALDIEQLTALYRSGQGSPDGKQRFGVEIETWCVTPQASANDTLVMMTPSQSQQILSNIANADPSAKVFYEENGIRSSVRDSEDTPIVYVGSQNISYQLELSGVIEAATDPVLLENFPDLLDLVDNAQSTVEKEANVVGLKTYPYAVPASIEITNCNDNLVKRERLISEWKKFASLGSDNPGLRTMGLATSTQINLSYANDEDAYEIMTLGNLLSPILYAVFSNTTGFIEGQEARSVPRARWWLEHNKFAPRGGIPELILDAMFSDDPKDMITNWIEYVRDVPMVFFFDENGDPKFDTSPTFNELANRGLGTAANFSLAESLVWPDVKLIGGQRIELRACDTGIWQPAGLSVFAASIFGTRETRRKCLSDIFNQTGIDRAGLIESRNKVDSMGMNAPYGKGTIRDVLPILLPYVEAYAKNLEEASATWKPLLTVLKTGVSDQMRIVARKYPNAKTADFNLCPR